MTWGMDRAATDDSNVKGVDYSDREDTDNLDRDDFEIDDWRRYKGTQKYVLLYLLQHTFLFVTQFWRVQNWAIMVLLAKFAKIHTCKIVAWTERKGTYLLQSKCAESMPTLCVYIYI